MNHGIKIVRHSLAESNNTPPVAPSPGVLHTRATDRTSDEELVAHLLCSRLHDDEYTSDTAKACHTLHVWPPERFAAPDDPLMGPDATCVIRRTAALKKWNGVGEPAAVACGEVEPA